MNTILCKKLARLFSNNASYHRISRSLSMRLFSTSQEGECATSSEIFDLLRHKHQISPQVASKVASVLDRVEDPEKCDSILTFFKESGFSNAQLEKVAKYRPKVLSVSLEGVIKPKIRVFQDFGFSSDDIAKTISACPTILLLNLNNRVIPSFSVLKGLLGTNDAVIKLWRTYSWFLIGDLERSMIPNIEFLKSCGIKTERILGFLFKYPNCLMMHPEVIRNSVEKAEKMGFERNSKMFIYGVRIVSSHSHKSWELKLQALQNFEFSESDVRKMFRKGPQVFGLSVERLKRAKDVIIATGKYGISCIVNNPTSLAHNIERRLKPRLQILEILERKNLIKSWPKLGTVSMVSEEKFFKKYVEPYLSEVGDVYNAKNFSMANKENKLTSIGLNNQN